MSLYHKSGYHLMCILEACQRDLFWKSATRKMSCTTDWIIIIMASLSVMLHIVRSSMFLMLSQSVLLQIERRHREDIEILHHRIVISVQVHKNFHLYHITGIPKPVIKISDFNHSLSIIEVVLASLDTIEP